MKFLGPLQLLLLISIGACQTSPRPKLPPLPFHVAMAPLGEVAKRETQLPEQMRFDLGTEGLAILNESIALALREESFSQVTVMQPRSKGTSGRADEWSAIVDARNNTKADVLLTVDLQYGTGIYHSISPARLHATPFWLLPGPHYWAAQDHRYGVDATLTFKLFDLARCSDGEEDRPIELRRWFFSQAVSMHDLEYDFVDRVGLHLYYYLIGLVVPSTLLRREGSDIEDNLGEGFTQQLADRVAEEIQLNRSGLIRNEHDYSFHLVSSDLQVTRPGPERALVEFSMDLQLGRSRNQPVALSLFPGEWEVAPPMQRLTQTELLQAVRAETPSSNSVRYRFQREIAVEPGTRNLRLHVAAGNSIATVREFTLRLPPYVAAE
jgi:hypothetical protein